MALGFDIPDYKKIRIILDTDAACEADDPFAIVHALLSPKLLVQGIVAEHFNEEGSMQRSYEEIMTILHAMEMEVPVFKGQPGKMAEDEVPSEAVEFIRNEALREDTHPLYVLCQGAITNVALALKLYPEIKDKMRVIWIGTHGEAPRKAPFREFNAGNDLEAANLVLTSGVDLWLVPSLVYGTIHIGIAEIERRIKPCGAIGEHLYQQLIDYNMGPFAGWTQGESWSLGDSPAIALAINPACGKFKEIPAPVVAEDTSSEVDESRPIIRVYTEIDARYILEDMIAKLELHYK
ncbi:MAG: nucleoside hydrolase [Lachnospiraceae bacterium]|nr:nucleoside hydrolase [Clostridiales bacterium]MDY3108641.1 nucleoside hydrolase [Lachnospiraceae bacterium]